MKRNQEEVVSTLLDDEGFLYVCGDAQNMARNVRETLMLCLQNVKGTLYILVNNYRIPNNNCTVNL